MPAGIVNQLWKELKQQGSSLPIARRVPEEYHVFCSFDLVNSTALKAKHKAWPVIISSFSDFVIDAVSKRVENLVPWKFLGDEVIFTQQIHQFKDLYDLLPKVYDTLHFVIRQIQERFPNAKGMVSVRGTAWGAFCLNGVGDLEKTSQKVAEQPDRNIRIARLKGGAELAYFASHGGGRAKRIERCLRIVSYQKLKGIWSERRYPIVWYDEHWETLEKSFGYDERYDDPLIESLLKEKPLPISNLHKVFSDLGQFERLKDGYKILRKLKTAPRKSTVRFQPASELSLLHAPAQHVHCVAVCLDGRGRCLIAKRPKTKKLFPEHWEFGCGQLGKSQSFEECLVQAYKDDFGAKLDRASLRPLSTFMIDGTPKIPGIIFTGRVSNSQNVKAKKHSELRWITPKDLPKFSQEPCVPGFNATVLATQSLVKSKKKN